MKKTPAIISCELPEAEWLNAAKLVIEFMKTLGVSQAEINYDFILEKDIQGQPQPTPKTVDLISLYSQIELDMKEGIIEYCSSTNCRIDFDERLSMILDNDCFILLEANDATFLRSVGDFLRLHQVDTFEPAWPSTPSVAIAKGSFLDKFLSLFTKRKRL